MPRGLRTALLLLAALFAASPARAADLGAIAQKVLRGEYASAAADLGAALQADGKDAAARALLARVHLETGEYAKAETEGRKAVESDPKSAEAREALAEALLARGRYAEAATMVREVLAADKDRLRARLTLYEAAMMTGAYQEAELVLEHFFDYYNAKPNLSSEELTLISQGAWAYGLRKGDKNSQHQAVEKLLGAACDADPSNVEALVFGGYCYLNKHDWSHAKTWFESALKVNPNHALATLGLAGCANAGNDRQAGEQALQRALSLNSSLREAIIAGAGEAIRKRQWGPAAEAIRKALEVDPNHPETLAHAAFCDLMQRNPAAAEARTKLALEVNPKPAVYWYTLGELHGNRLLFEEAQAYLDKAVECDPSNWDALLAAGMNALRLGREEQAKRQIDLATLKDPFNMWGINTWRLLHDYDKKFSVRLTPHYRMRFHNSEVEFMEPYVTAIAEDCWKTLSARYKFTPAEPVVLEMFPDHNDLSVRTFGLGGLGILGACFGKVVVVDSPKAQEVHGPFNWASVIWHEMAHVFHLQVSGNRVPRWFTEGLATYEEKMGRPGWEREMEMDIFRAWHAGTLSSIEKMDQGDTGSGGDLLNYYLYGSLISEYIHTQHGFDKILEILKLYKEGKTTPEAFQQALGMDLPKLEATLGAYVRSYLERTRLRAPITKEKEKEIVARFGATPEDPAALADYSRLLLEKDKLADAQMHAERALEKDPKNVTALLTMAHLWNNKRPPRRKKAIEAFEKAIEAGADDYGTHFTLARCYHEEKELDKAESEYLQARRCFPRAVFKEESPTRYLLEIYKEREESEKYVAELEYLVSIVESDFPHRMELAKIYRQENQRDKMLAMLEQAIWVEPRDLKLHAYLAEAYRETGRPDEAARECRACILLAERVNPDGKLNSRIADWWCDIAEIRLGQGKKPEALDALVEAQKVLPTHERIKELRAKAE